MRIRPLLALGAAVAAVGIAALPASTASASGPVTLKQVQVERVVVLQEHQTANSGWVEFRTEKVSVAANSPAAAMRPMTITSVGGGTWDYGSAATGGGKACHSYYNHPSVSHGSSVVLGSKSDYENAGAGSTSFAYVKGSYFSTCKAYWHKN